MKAVIYPRYSSDSQREESIEGQIRECKEYAEKNGMTVLTTYIDRALSAKTDNRPEFQRMIRDSANGLFDVVLVWKLDRFSRDRYDSAHYKRILKKNGVKVISVKESIAEDSTGILLESLLEGYAEYYSAELSEKVQRGHKENALKGKCNGGNIPYGYIVNKEQYLEINPAEAPIVQEIFTRYAEGESCRSIIASLNKHNIKSNRNKPFAPTIFTAMLRNRKYVGEYRYGDVFIPDGIPAIIDKELFQMVQDRVAKNKHAPARSKTTADEEYILTTKLFCGDCGRLMAGESGRGRNGIVHYYYKCGNAKRGLGCKKKAVKKLWIEDIVVDRTIKLLFDDNMLAYLAEQAIALQKRENTTLPQLKQQLSKLEQGIENIVNAIQQGIITKSTKQRLDELEEAKSKVELCLAQAELEQPTFSKEQLLCWLYRFRKLDISKPEHRRQLVDYFVNSVYVFDDRLVLTFNYKDSTETVSLADINGSDIGGVLPPKEGQHLVLSFFFDASAHPGNRARQSTKKTPYGAPLCVFYRPLTLEGAARRMAASSFSSGSKKMRLSPVSPRTIINQRWGALAAEATSSTVA